MLVMMMQPNQNRKPPKFYRKTLHQRRESSLKIPKQLDSSLISEHQQEIELLRVMMMIMVIQPNQDHKPQNTSERRTFQLEVDVAESSIYMTK